MKGYLLDTNVVSELRKQKPHGAVLVWTQGLRNEETFISAITLGELQAGVELTRTQDPTKAQEIERWVDRLAGLYEVLPMDARCFREWARLMHKKSDRLIEDAMIAATARLHDLVIATRNERDFIDFDVQIYNPFKS
ncbi:MAG TPA: type II toxin-antitoxin system VapC family toxin [Terriglobales bacterium]|nr:type II toxin-antitoxin system VapC family toxin [Terriglobales bacterium]